LPKHVFPLNDIEDLIGIGARDFEPQELPVFPGGTDPTSPTVRHVKKEPGRISVRRVLRSPMPLRELIGICMVLLNIN
jgi:hypothetical protein